MSGGEFVLKNKIEDKIISLEKSLVVVRDFVGNELQLAREGEDIWATGEQWGELLEYENPRISISNLFKNHKDEFTNDITRVINMITLPGQPPQRRRQFNLEGFALICMFSEQPKAKEARVWARKLMREMWVYGMAVQPQILQVTPEQLSEVITAALQRASEKGGLIRPSEHEVMQTVFMGNLEKMKGWIDEDPVRYNWVLPQMQEHLGQYISHYKIPRIGKTKLNGDLFAHFWMELRWSRDAIIAHFPKDLTSIINFEKWRKRMGLPQRKAKAIPTPVGLLMYRDHTQFFLSVDEVVIHYKYYSRDAVQRHIREIGRNIINVHENNPYWGVEPNKKSHDEYRASEQWDKKKTVLVPPDGPFDLCWDCHRPISKSTAQLHHLTYARAGIEDWQDWRPLCSSCHIYRHPERNGLPVGTVNPDKWVKFSNVRTTRAHESGKSFFCEINGTEWNITYWAVDEKNSEVKKFGDRGTLIIKESFAIKRGIPY